MPYCTGPCPTCMTSSSSSCTRGRHHATSAPATTAKLSGTRSLLAAKGLADQISTHTHSNLPFCSVRNKSPVVKLNGEVLRRLRQELERLLSRRRRRVPVPLRVDVLGSLLQALLQAIVFDEPLDEPGQARRYLFVGQGVLKLVISRDEHSTADRRSLRNGTREEHKTHVPHKKQVGQDGKRQNSRGKCTPFEHRAETCGCLVLEDRACLLANG